LDEERIPFADVYKLFKKKEEIKPEKIFNNREEYVITASIIAAMLENDIRVAIYEVENFENLFDYADVFSRLQNAGVVPFFGQEFKFITVTTYPHNEDIADAVTAATADGFKPIVAYFMVTSYPAVIPAQPVVTSRNS